MSKTLWLVTVAKTHRRLPCVDTWGIYPDRRTACDEALAEYPELEEPLTVWRRRGEGADAKDSDTTLMPMFTSWAGDDCNVEVTIVACDVGEPL